jgi:hypothetical protein
VNSFTSRLATVLFFASVCATAAWAEGERRGATDYLHHCSGCHDVDGSGHPNKGIPDFRGQVGYFLRWREGRAFLLQVPGLLNSGLSDERAAGVVTWLVRRFAGPSLPPDFEPYTADEARRYRESRPVDIAAARQRLYMQIVEAGYPLTK